MAKKKVRKDFFMSSSTSTKGEWTGSKDPVLKEEELARGERTLLCSISALRSKLVEKTDSIEAAVKNIKVLMSWGWNKH